MHVFSWKKENTKEEIVSQIILENYNQYYRLAYSYVHNEPDACDIVQSGAYKALQNSHSLKKTEFAKTWVYRIMLNECFNYMKKPEIFSYEAIQEKDGIDIGYTEDAYQNIDLQRAIDKLPKEDKAIIILRYFEDKKIEEIAEILNENISTVKSRLYRSMGKLRQSLKVDNE